MCTVLVVSCTHGVVAACCERMIIELRIKEVISIIVILTLVGTQIKHGFDDYNNVNAASMSSYNNDDEEAATTMTMTTSHHLNQRRKSTRRRRRRRKRKSGSFPLLQDLLRNRTSANTDTTTTTTSNTITDWFLRSDWKPNINVNKCFYMENFCHTNQHWFYDDKTTTESNINTPLQQQPKNLIFQFRKYVLNKDMPKVYPDILQVMDHPLPYNNNTTQTCVYSPITNHLVLHSNFNHMLGEFYTRTLLGVYDMIVHDIHGYEYLLASSSNSGEGSNNTDDNDSNVIDDDEIVEFDQDFMTNTQFYIHMKVHGGSNDNIRHKILESHKLLLGMFTLNPLLDFRTLLDNLSNTCRCLKRIIFCGYINSNGSSNNNNKGGGDDQSMDNAVIVPAATIEKTSTNENNDGSDPTTTSTTTNVNMNINQEVITTLRNKLVYSNPLIQDKIYKYRYGQIKDQINQEFKIRRRQNPHVVITKQQLLDEWIFVGLSQRTKRRSWNDLFSMKQQCNGLYSNSQYKIHCTIINVEDMINDNPIKHLILHASINVFVGIHGAQLTEGILMNNNKHNKHMNHHPLLVELLPWIYPGDIEDGDDRNSTVVDKKKKKLNSGGWTRWTHRPTPLGVIYSDTDINHIGVPLTRDSVSKDFCSGINYNSNCFDLIEENSWDNRNFYTNFTMVQDIIEKFVLTPKRKTMQQQQEQQTSSSSTTVTMTCEEYQNLAGEEYVLYNIHCIDTKAKPPKATIQHYYRPSDWISKKQAPRHESDSLRAKDLIQQQIDSIATTRRLSKKLVES